MMRTIEWTVRILMLIAWLCLLTGIAIAQGSGELTGNFGDIAVVEDHASSGIVGDPTTQSAFSGYLNLYGRQYGVTLPKLWVLVTRMEQDQRTYLWRMTEDVYRVGMCQSSGETEPNAWFRPTGGCINEYGSWNTGPTAFMPGRYHVRAYGEGYFHPIWDEREEFYVGRVQLYTMNMYKMEVKLVGEEVVRDGNVLIVSGYLVNQSRWRYDVRIDLSVTQPSYSKESAPLGQFPIVEGWLEPDRKYPFKIPFWVNEWVGSDGHGELCFHANITNRWWWSMVYVDRSVCIPADTNR
jgi:hypothetical protein